MYSNAVAKTIDSHCFLCVWTTYVTTRGAAYSQMILSFASAKKNGRVPSAEAYAAMLQTCALYGDVKCATETLRDMQEYGVVC